VVHHGCGDAGETRRDLAVLGGVPALPGLDQKRPKRRERRRSATVPVDESGPVGEERTHLHRGERGQDRPSAGGQVRGKTYAGVGDQRGTAGSAFLEHVEDVATVQHREVGTVADAVDESGEGPTGDALERFLARVPATDLEGGDTEAEALLLGQVGHEAFRDHRVDQVVRRRAR